jgi:4'-phosphopantetheinyl transferase
LDWHAAVVSVLFSQVLSADERVRAQRFRYAQHRDRFVIARGALRTLLGCYLQTAPAQLEFTYGPHGKPSLSQGGLEFNLSHSAHLAVIAVAADRPVGIDLEQVHPINDLEKLTERFFTSGEHQRLLRLPAAQRLPNFFRGWTCKEAYLKATGEGLGQLHSPEVYIQPQQAAYFVNPPDWQVQELEVEEGFVGAIAAPGQGWTTRLWQYDIAHRHS